MLLHYLVVPGLGDGTRSRTAAATADADRVAPFDREDRGDREDVAVPAVPAEAGGESPATEAVRAA